MDPTVVAQGLFLSTEIAVRLGLRATSDVPEEIVPVAFVRRKVLKRLADGILDLLVGARADENLRHVDLVRASRHQERCLQRPIAPLQVGPQFDEPAQQVHLQRLAQATGALAKEVQRLPILGLRATSRAQVHVLNAGDGKRSCLKERHVSLSRQACKRRQSTTLFSLAMDRRNT